MKYLLAAFCLLLCPPAFSQDNGIPTDELRIRNGEKLYKDKCSRCHLFGKQKIGPSLAGITDKRPTEWLTRLIRSSQQVIASGDAYALHLYQSYNRMVMPDFHELAESEILEILAYIQHQSLDPQYVFNPDSISFFDQEILEKARTRQSVTEEQKVTLPADSLMVPVDLQSVQNGASHFRELCASCHRFDLRITGPPLASVTDRRSAGWLIAFIRSPATMIKNDTYASFLATNYPMVMPDFDFLTDPEILDILAYLRYETGAETHTAGSHANAILAPASGPGHQKVYPSDTQGVKGEKTLPNSGISKSPSIEILGIVLTAGMVVLILVLVWRIFRM